MKKTKTNDAWKNSGLWLFICSSLTLDTSYDHIWPQVGRSNKNMNKSLAGLCCAIHFFVFSFSSSHTQVGYIWLTLYVNFPRRTYSSLVMFGSIAFSYIAEFNKVTHQNRRKKLYNFVFGKKKKNRNQKLTPKSEESESEDHKRIISG